MNPSPRTRRALVVALVVSALGESARAQSTEPATSPAAPSEGLPPPPVWIVPPPLSAGERVPVAHRPLADAPLAEPAPLPVERVCPDRQRPTRIIAETLAGAAVTAAALFIGRFALDATSGGGIVLGTLGALATHIIVSPAAMVLVGNAFEGRGRYWSTVLGHVLLPVAGGVLGYELSHEPACDEVPARGGRASRRRALPVSPPVRFAPAVTPVLTGAAGATAGLSVTF